MHYVYVLRSLSDEGLYIGYSANLRRRLVQHNEGAAFATSHRGPWTLIWTMRSEAGGPFVPEGTWPDYKTIIPALKHWAIIAPDQIRSAYFLLPNS